MANPDPAGNSKAPDRLTPPYGGQIGIELELYLNVPTATRQRSPT